MAKQRLFQHKPSADDKREPHDKFSDFVQKIVRVSKSEIDDRDARWQAGRKSKAK